MRRWPSISAVAFMGKGDYEAALRDFDEVVRLKPQSAGLHYDRGNAHRAAGA